jgi:hypothetical protein
MIGFIGSTRRAMVVALAVLGLATSASATILAASAHARYPEDTKPCRNNIDGAIFCGP